MPCHKKHHGKFLRIRAVDVGRPGHHYIKIGVRKKAGPRGGHTHSMDGIKTFKHFKKYVR